MAYRGLETIRRGNTAACVKDIFEIHFQDAKSVLDVTYGKGRFWNWPNDLDIIGMDIDPPGPVDIIGDYRQIPLKAGSVDVLTFDPMFLFSRGIRAVNGSKRHFMGAEAANYEGRTWSKQDIVRPRNPKDLLEHYRRIFEQRDIAKQGIILKGQDLVTSTRRDWWSFHVYNLALEMGMGEPTDILVQHSPASRMRDPRWKNQYFLRAAHCTYFVYKYA